MSKICKITGVICAILFLPFASTLNVDKISSRLTSKTNEIKNENTEMITRRKRSALADDSFYTAPEEYSYDYGPVDNADESAVNPDVEESRQNKRKAKFEDIGPPDGFFSDGLDGAFEEEEQDKEESRKNPKKPEEEEDEENLEYDDEIEHDAKTKKCKVIHKKTMSCEICVDDFGSFTEHCNHHAHRGKDGKEENPDEAETQDYDNPLNEYPDAEYDDEDNEKNQRREQSKNYAESLPRQQYSRPIRYNNYGAPLPYYDDYYGESRRQEMYAMPSNNYDDEVEYSNDREDDSSAEEKEFDRSYSEPEQNYRMLTKMVNKFKKKDRRKCHKVRKTNGMLCYVCPTKNGEVKENCAFQNVNPKRGVHLAYNEQISY